MNRMPRFVWRVLVWLVLVALVAVLAVTVLVPRLGGGTPYTVLTGSMRPAMPAGTLVVARPVDPDEVRVGDVVTVQLESGKDTYVTHRVVSVEHRLDGTLRFETQGDANTVADEELRRPAQIRGKRWYSVRYLGYVNNLLTGPQRQTAVYVAAGGLLMYAGWMFGAAAWGRRRGVEDQSGSRTPEREKETTS